MVYLRATSRPGLSDGGPPLPVSKHPRPLRIAEARHLHWGLSSQLLPLLARSVSDTRPPVVQLSAVPSLVGPPSVAQPRRSPKPFSALSLPKYLPSSITACPTLYVLPTSTHAHAHTPPYHCLARFPNWPVRLSRGPALCLHDRTFLGPCESPCLGWDTKRTSLIGNPGLPPPPYARAVSKSEHLLTQL